MKNVAAVTVPEATSNLFPTDFALLGKTETHLKWQIPCEKWEHPIKGGSINVTEKFEARSDNNKLC